MLKVDLLKGDGYAGGYSDVAGGSVSDTRNVETSMTTYYYSLKRRASSISGVETVVAHTWQLKRLTQVCATSLSRRISVQFFSSSTNDRTHGKNQRGFCDASFHAPVP